MNAEFPERPGALRKFLSGTQTKWNISLFHYRNHGAGEKFLLWEARLCSTNFMYLEDIGKVLAGIQVPPEDNAEFDSILKQVGYAFVEETENPVYKRLLRG